MSLHLRELLCFINSVLRIFKYFLLENYFFKYSLTHYFFFFQCKSLRNSPHSIICPLEIQKVCMCATTCHVRVQCAILFILKCLWRCLHVTWTFRSGPALSVCCNTRPAMSLLDNTVKADRLSQAIKMASMKIIATVDGEDQMRSVFNLKCHPVLSPCSYHP